MTKPLASIFLPTLMVGGAEKVLVELANGLEQHEWRAQLVTMSRKGSLINSVSPRVEVVDLNCATYRKAVLALARHYDKSRPQIVLTSLYATGISAIAANFLSKHKPKTIVGCHNSLRAKIARPDNLKDRYFLRPLARILLPHADAFAAVSEGVAKEVRTMLKLKEERIHVIYNPVVSPELLAQSKVSVDHPWLKASECRGFRTLVSVGRLVEQKGFDILLKAFARVKDQQDCRLIIVGDGPLRPHLELLAEDLGVRAFVDFVGLQYNPYKFISRADLFVLSSLWEGLPTVLIEALACGCPVVATDCDYGPYEILKGGAYGLLAPVDNQDALAGKIVEALGSNAVQHTDKETLRRRALDFTVESSVAQYARFFRDINAGGTRPA